MTISELLRQGTERLKDSPSALLDAEVILSHVIGEDREYLIRNSGEDVSSAFVDLFVQYVNRVSDGEPVAYITNLKEFYGLDFFVDNRVLIPRPETEEVVDKAMRFLSGLGSGLLKVLDVGTGSGNIAVSIAASFDRERDLLVDAVDVSEDALAVARVNVSSHSVEDRVHVFQSDLLSSVEIGASYDIIVANLPYIGEVENRFVSASAERYEPNVALFGGSNGLVLYEKMFDQLFDLNVSFGLLIGEFGFAQRDSMSRLLEKIFPDRWQIENDLAGIERIFIVEMNK